MFLGTDIQYPAPVRAAMLRADLQEERSAPQRRENRTAPARAGEVSGSEQPGSRQNPKLPYKKQNGCEGFNPHTFVR